MQMEEMLLFLILEGMVNRLGLILSFLVFLSGNPLFSQELSLVHPKEDQFFAESVLFNWNEVEDANVYELQIASDSLFQNLLISRSSVTNELSETFNSTGRFYWRVIVSNLNATVDTSQISHFSIFKVDHFEIRLPRIRRVGEPVQPLQRKSECWPREHRHE